MYLCKLLIIIFCHSSLTVLQFPYPKQTFELPNHPSNWMCTVHVTVATFANYTTSDITERFLASNRERIIPTVGVMLNRSISIVPVNSFYEPCTISVLIDATIHGSSYVFKGERLYNYINGNEYAYGGWKHSIIILIYFLCTSGYNNLSLLMPHRLFYHSLDCGYHNIFPNHAFVSDPLQTLRDIADPTHSIHDRQLPLAIRRSISAPKYGWDSHDPNIKPDQCLSSRWDELSEMFPCDFGRFAVHHYQIFINFTAVAYTPDNVKNYGEMLTRAKFNMLIYSITWHTVGSSNTRVAYCDRKSDSPRLRPLSLSSPFSFETWVILVFLLTFLAIARSFTIIDIRSVANDWTIVIFVQTIFSSLFEQIICLLEKDIGKNSCTKAFIGLIVICLGNTYKNYLTIELVFPRAGDPISNFTELLELNFNLLEPVNVKNIGHDKSTWLKNANYLLEIDETKREKYATAVEKWLKLISHSDENIGNEIASVTSKNAWIITAPYFIQVHILNVITQRNRPLSCHFVKRPFAHQFDEFYFFNPKAEEFKWWTTKFLDHGLFNFWKRLHTHMNTLEQRQISLEDRSEGSNSSSVETFDLSNFIEQVHLIVFYIVIAVLTAICVAIFLLECAIKNAQALSLFTLKKFKHVSLQLLWTIVRSIFLMSRLIGRICQNCKPF
jgi:hypothetical protein